MRTNKGVLRTLVALGAGSAMALFFGVSSASADAGPHMSRQVTLGNNQVNGGAVTSTPVTVPISGLGADRCASCHRIHTAKSSNGMLLVMSDETSLCYTCHGDAGLGSKLNVQSGVQFTAADGSKTQDTVYALRGGGFARTVIDGASATKDATSGVDRNGNPAAVFSNYKIGVSAGPTTATSSHFGGVATMWGNTATFAGNADPTVTVGFSATADPGKVMGTTKLECGSCHDPHGNGQYRILKPVPSASGYAVKTMNVATNTLNTAAGVFIQDTANKVYTTTNYWQFQDIAATDTYTNRYLGGSSAINPTPLLKTMTSGTADSYTSNVAAWCTTCHTRYLAPSGSRSTSSGDAIYTYRHTSDTVSNYKNPDGSYNTSFRGDRNCAQCHVSHGTSAQMSANSAVEWPGTTTPKTTDSRLLRADDRGVCLMCHNY